MNIDNLTTLHSISCITHPWMILSTLCAAVFLPVRTVFAGETCTPLGNGLLHCTAVVDTDRMAMVAAYQETDKWCWAASISMIFGYHGHPIDQAEIVQRTFGKVVNRTSGVAWVMTHAINKVYVDKNGSTFRGRTVVQDLEIGQMGVNNTMIAGELAAGNPLVVGTQGHAMVLAGMEYIRTGSQVVNVISAIVYDPWPTNGGVRSLTPSEMIRPTYLAIVRTEEAVTDSDSDETSPERDHEEEGSSLNVPSERTGDVSPQVYTPFPSENKRGYRGFMLFRVGFAFKGFPVAVGYSENRDLPKEQSRAYFSYSLPMLLGVDFALVDTRFFGLQVSGSGYFMYGMRGLNYGGVVGGGVWAGIRPIGLHGSYSSEWRGVDVDADLSNSRGHLEGKIEYRLDQVSFGLRSCWREYYDDSGDGGCIKMGALWNRTSFVDRLSEANLNHAWGGMLDFWHFFGSWGLGAQFEMAGRYPIASDMAGPVAGLERFRRLSTTVIVQMIFRFGWGSGRPPGA